MRYLFLIVVCLGTYLASGGAPRSNEDHRGDNDRPTMQNEQDIAASTERAKAISAHGDSNESQRPNNQDRQLPAGPLGEEIQLGRQLILETATHSLTKDYVGNSLNCNSCHLEAGTHAEAATFIGVATAYPAYAPREKSVITLEDRILNCFMRSMNGTRPANGSRPSVAMAAYITWLSSGQQIKQNAEMSLGPRHLEPLELNPKDANLESGREVYENQCADCHGEDGNGMDDWPPVWGNRSYNKGAGFYKNAKLASWIKVAMPPDDESLTPQEAMDVAAFINSHHRPDFIPPENDGKNSSRQNSK